MDVVLITTAELHLTQLQLSCYPGSNPARRVSEIRDGDNFCQWSAIEITLKTYDRNHITKAIHSSSSLVPTSSI